MNKLITCVALLSATSALACRVSVGGQGAQQPQAGNTAPAATTPAPQGTVPTPVPAGGPQVTGAGGRISGFGKRSPASTSTTGTMTGGGTTTTPETPSGVPVMSGTNPFGSGTPDPNGGWQGTVYWIPAGTTTMPALDSATPAGILFAPSLNVANQAMSGGFPGIDAARNENFAIRWESALVVENEADYEIRVHSDDGAILSMDGMVIVDNNGVHDAQDKTGPVHLVRGTHLVRVDYFQSTANVALQVFVKKPDGTEISFPNRL